MAMGAAIVVLFFLPWIDRNNVRSIRYRSVAYKVLLFSFVIAFIVLGYYGMQTPCFLSVKTRKPNRFRKG